MNKGSLHLEKVDKLERIEFLHDLSENEDIDNSSEEKKEEDVEKSNNEKEEEVSGNLKDGVINESSLSSMNKR